VKYPIYRKYSNNKSYFKVLDESHFEEIQILGSRYLLYSFEAKILPDRNLMHDMVEMSGGGWEEIDAKTYEELREKCN
jgi:hypothetical protein